MKKYLFTGLITLLPLILTLMLFSWLFNLFTDPLVGISEALIAKVEGKLGLNLVRHRELALFLSRVGALLLLIATIFILGFCGQRFLNTFLLKIVEKVFSKIPLIRSVYKISHEVTKSLFSPGKKTFQETVLVPFPHEKVLSVGFVTGSTPEVFKQPGMPLTDVAVFVPTAPHPMSGFMLLTPREFATPVDVSVEEAFKYLISCGVVHPGESIEKLKT